LFLKISKPRSASSNVELPEVNRRAARPFRHLQPVRLLVDGDDLRGAGHPGAVHGELADRAGVPTPPTSLDAMSHISAPM
jgi:hypothetical protein